MSAQATSSKRRKREARRALAWLGEAQAALGWGVIIALAAVLGTIYLYQASRIATVGRTVQDLQSTLGEVKRQNATFERQIAEAQSLQRLQEEASRLGFVRAEPDSVDYVVIPDYPATVSVPELEPVTVPEPPATLGEALWLFIQERVGNLNQGESP
ncbi:MAG: hypothetical protein R3300_04670 [Candidatus Promineifilaceae bacterium]|nr:hypothetical protein [Candidatus Promineifilaceae bacterium]